MNRESDESGRKATPGMRRRCSGEKPPLYAVVKLYFPAGAEQAGYWNGSSWIAGGFAVSPTDWEPGASEPNGGDPGLGDPTRDSHTGS